MTRHATEHPQAVADTPAETLQVITPSLTAAEFERHAVQARSVIAQALYVPMIGRPD